MKVSKNILVILLSVVFIFPVLNSFAQKEANWWYFGSKAGLNFNSIVSGLPTPVSNGAMVTQEGCASISDANGRLLFYTDGKTVWNRNHVVMSNGTGLLGNFSSTQSAVIVPFPGNSKKYYVFTIWTSTSTGFRYSVVDMAQSSGLGSVISTSKNTLVFAPTCERITAGARTGGGYWVLAQHKSSNRFSAYAVTTSGVATTAVTTAIGPTPNASGIGYMKLSPKGDKLGVGYHRVTVFLLDFDKRTGILSNLREDKNNRGAYGVEFSPDGKLFYAAPANSTVRQYNAYTASSTAFIASASSFATSGKNSYALQLGPDGKIYVTNYMKNQLSVIHNPNVVGVGCSLSLSGPTIPTGAHSRIGFPTFVQSFFNPTTFSVKDACDKEWVKISVKDTGAVDSVFYNYGDTASSSNTSWNRLDSHIFSGPGKYEVLAYAFYSSAGKVFRDTLRDTVTVLQIPIVVLPNDTTICTSDSILGLITNAKWADPFQRLWQDSSKGKWMHIGSTGKFYLSATNRCGTGSDTINIDSLFKRTLDLGNDTVICLGDSLVFDISDTSATYLWSDGYKKPNRVIDSTDVYWAQSTNLCGTIRDTISIEVLAPPKIDLGMDKSLCKSKSQYAIFGDNGVSKYSYYTWSNGLKGPGTYRIITYNAGTFWVEEKNKCGVAMDTINILADVTIPPFFGRDSVVCLGDTITLRPRIKLKSELWSTGSKDSSILIYQGGTYWLRASNSCGKRLDTINYVLREVPQIGLPSDSIICIGDSATLEVKSPNTNFLWSTGATVSLIWASKTGVYWVRASNVCGLDIDTVKIEVDGPAEVSLQRDTFICNTDQIIITAKHKYARTFLWNTGNLTDKQNINRGGRYRVMAINKCGVDSASIEIDHEYTPVPNLGPDTTICQGDKIELRTQIAPELLSYSQVKWNGKYDSKELYVDRSGFYKVVVSNRCGVGEDEMEVKVRGLPRIKAKDTIVCDNIIEYDNTNTSYEFLWQDGSTSKRYRIKSPGDYSVEMWDELGCYSSVRFVVRQCPSEMWSPSAFSPNYDELNESFRVYKDGIYAFEIEIYDRWNKLVFQSNDINKGWQGTVDNDPSRVCAQGMYIWKVKFREEENNQLQIVIGEVNLVR